MTHVVMVEAYGPGAIVALDRAAQKYQATFIRAHGEHEKRYVGPKTDAVLAKVNVVTLEDTTDEHQLERALAALHAERPIDAVFSMFHPVVLPLARATARLGLPFTNVTAVERASIKHLARARLVECGVPSIRYASIDEPSEAAAAAERIGFPLVVKPSGGVGKSFATIVRDREQMMTAVEGYFANRGSAGPMFRRGLEGSLMLEEYMEGPMVSAEVASVSADSPKAVLGIEIRKRARDNEIVELATSLPAPLSETEE